MVLLNHNIDWVRYYPHIGRSVELYILCDNVPLIKFNTTMGSIDSTTWILTMNPRYKPYEYNKNIYFGNIF